MCIQSYYNNNNDVQEIELDLLAEIKRFGIEQWGKRVENERKIDHARTAASVDQAQTHNMKNFVVS
ncbi:MAG: hypothetical protein ABH896_01460 [Candidatus Jacksonbacteria bacterium]